MFPYETLFPDFKSFPSSLQYTSSGKKDIKLERQNKGTWFEMRRKKSRKITKVDIYYLLTVPLVLYLLALWSAEKLRKVILLFTFSSKNSNFHVLPVASRSSREVGGEIQLSSERVVAELWMRSSRLIRVSDEIRLYWTQRVYTVYLPEDKLHVGGLPRRRRH